MKVTTLSVSGQLQLQPNTCLGLTNQSIKDTSQVWFQRQIWSGLLPSDSGPLSQGPGLQTGKGCGLNPFCPSTSMAWCGPGFLGWTLTSSLWSPSLAEEKQRWTDPLHWIAKLAEITFNLITVTDKGMKRKLSWTQMELVCLYQQIGNQTIRNTDLRGNVLFHETSVVIFLNIGCISMRQNRY